MDFPEPLGPMTAVTAAAGSRNDEAAMARFPSITASMSLPIAAQVLGSHADDGCAHRQLPHSPSTSRLCPRT